MKRYIFFYFLFLFFSINCYANNKEVDTNCVANGMKKEFTKAEIAYMQADIKKNNVLSEKYKDRLDIIVKNCLK